jgi:hypothetical protein
MKKIIYHQKSRYWSAILIGSLLILGLILVESQESSAKLSEAQKPRIVVGQESPTGHSDAEKARIHSKMASLQVPFIANKGQEHEKVGFYAKTFGGTLFVTRQGEMVYSLPYYNEQGSKIRDQRTKTRNLKAESRNSSTKGWVLKEVLVGGRINEVRGRDKAATKINFFSGNDQNKWQSHVSSYNEVSFGEVY